MLAKILQKHYDIEIIGPTFGKELWYPVQFDSSMFKIIEGRNIFKITKNILKAINGDVLYAIKPLFTSYGVALLKRKITKMPLVLDIDDWEIGFIFNKIKKLNLNTANFLFFSIIHPFYPGSFFNAFFTKLVSLADEITVSNTFLRKKFGGVIIWHARDTDFLNPDKFDREQLRRQYGIELQKKIAIFLGTVREHKGLEYLIKAISLAKHPELVLWIVGLEQGLYKNRLENLCNQLLGDNFKIFGIQPLDKVPVFLAMSDIVIVPQQENLATVGQVPAKVFDAMAMAKPIIATNVSDLPQILDSIGWIVESNNTERLAGVIKYILSNPLEARAKGRLARNKCIENYSWIAMELVLKKIFDKYS